MARCRVQVVAKESGADTDSMNRTGMTTHLQKMVCGTLSYLHFCIFTVCGCALTVSWCCQVLFSVFNATSGRTILVSGGRLYKTKTNWQSGPAGSATQIWHVNYIWHSIADLVVVVAARTSKMDSKRMDQMEYCKCKVQGSRRDRSTKGCRRGNIVYRNACNGTNVVKLHRAVRIDCHTIHTDQSY